MEHNLNPSGTNGREYRNIIVAQMATGDVR